MAYKVSMPSPTPKSKPKLTDKQRRFCFEYMVDLNATQAAIRAGYSKKRADSSGPRLLGNVGVQEFIEKLRGNQEERTLVKADQVIAELAKVGFSNIQDYIGEGNEIQDISEVKREVAAAVESIQVDIRHDGGDSEGYTEKVKLKLHSKLSALDSLCKHLGLYAKDKVVTVTLASAIKQVLYGDK